MDVFETSLWYYSQQLLKLTCAILYLNATGFRDCSLGNLITLAVVFCSGQGVTSAYNLSAQFCRVISANESYTIWANMVKLEKTTFFVNFFAVYVPQ